MRHKAFALMMAALFNLTLLGCAREEPRIPTVGEASETVLTEHPAVALETTEASYPTDVQTITVRFTNSAEEPYVCGRDYKLEIYSGSQWCDLTPAPSEKSFGTTDEGYSLYTGEPVEITHDLEYYGTQFDPGTYRVVSKVHVLDAPEERETIAAEFTITQRESDE